MSLFFISILVMVLVIAAMAIGVLAGRPPIKGSCGGMGALGVDASCEICGGSPQRCEEETRQAHSRKGKRDSKRYYSADK
ncbi:MAG: (Na+)-NQR maturation NqrM [Halioglobus sp.]